VFCVYWRLENIAVTQLAITILGCVTRAASVPNFQRGLQVLRALYLLLLFVNLFMVSWHGLEFGIHFLFINDIPMIWLSERRLPFCFALFINHIILTFREKLFLLSIISHPFYPAIDTNQPIIKYVLTIPFALFFL
jgi:hypothetical protein